MWNKTLDYLVICTENSVEPSGVINPHAASWPPEGWVARGGMCRGDLTCGQLLFHMWWGGNIIIYAFLHHFNMAYSIFNLKKAATKSLPVSVERAVWLYIPRAEVCWERCCFYPLSLLSLCGSAWSSPAWRGWRKWSPKPRDAAWLCTHYTHVAPASGSPPGQPQTAYDCLLQFFCFRFLFLHSAKYTF